MSLHQSARDFAQRKEVRRFGILMYAVAALFLFIVGIVLIYHLLQSPRNKCPETSHVLPDTWMIVWGAFALIVGRFVGSLRFKEEWRTPAKTSYTIPLRWSKGWWSDKLGQVALLGFLLLCTVALLYEAIGEQQFHLSANTPFPALAPITEYARCAIYDAKYGGSPGVLVYLVIFVICVLVGNWLWSYHVPEDFNPPSKKSSPTATHGPTSPAVETPVEVAHG